MMVTKENVILRRHAEIFKNEMLRYLHLLSNGLANIEYIWQDDNKWYI